MVNIWRKEKGEQSKGDGHALGAGNAGCTIKWNGEFDLKPNTSFFL